jgi:hypothetical protein
MKKIIVLALFLFGCGDEKYSTPVESGQLSTGQLSLLQSKCAGCHGGADFLTSQSAFESKAIPQILSGKMPKGGSLSEQEKEVLLCCKKS